MPRLAFGYYPFRMTAISATPQKKRGRPATGKDPAVTVRLPPKIIDAAQAYAERAGVTRAEVIRDALIGFLRRRGSLSHPQKIAARPATPK